MDINKITQDKNNQDLQKTYQQINNLEIINDKSDITINIPDIVMLQKLYDDLKTFGKTERNIFLTQISKIEGINAKNKKFSTMKNEQRTFLLQKLNERITEINKKIETTELLAHEA